MPIQAWACKQKGKSMKNRNKKEYKITVFFKDNSKKNFIRYSNKKNCLDEYFERITKKYGLENIELITSI